MPATSDESDLEMSKRLQTFFRKNPEFAVDYFRGGTHGGTSSPTGKNDHARHLEAVAHVQDLLQKEEAARAGGGGIGYAPAPRIAIERKIREAMDDKAYGDSKHRDHADAVSRVTYLYRQLSDSK